MFIFTVGKKMTSTAIPCLFFVKCP
uniref:Uncharacterized protein n=1 Tax=Anguilla anguilla TaxID=7936 RepID=A0A0E9SGV6_ANGAN